MSAGMNGCGIQRTTAGAASTTCLMQARSMAMRRSCFDPAVGIKRVSKTLLASTTITWEADPPRSSASPGTAMAYGNLLFSQSRHTTSARATSLNWSCSHSNSKTA